MFKTFITAVGMGLLAMAGVLVSSNPAGTRLRRLTLPIAAGGDTAGDLISVANPFGVPVMIVDWSLDITVASGGVATADFGVAANGTTTSATLADGLDINAVATYNPTDDAGAGGGKDRLWETTEFITGDVITGTDGLVAGQLTVWCLLGGAL